MRAAETTPIPWPLLALEVVRNSRLDQFNPPVCALVRSMLFRRRDDGRIWAREHRRNVVTVKPAHHVWRRTVS